MTIFVSDWARKGMQRMETTQRQIGRITSVQNGSATVSLERPTACGDCSARAHCHGTECRGEERRITAGATGFQPGDRVWVVTDTRSGMRALAWAYVIPLALLAAGFSLAMAACLADYWCALAALAPLPVWYGLLHRREKHGRNRFPVHLEPVNN